MSCENRLYTTETNVNAHLKQMGLDGRFTGEEKRLLAEYHSIAESADYSFLLVCAQEAMQTVLQTYPTAVLSPYGVLLKDYLRDGYWHNDHALIEAQKSYADNLFEATRLFICEWEKIRQEKLAHKAAINAQLADNKDLLANSPYLLMELRTVCERLVADGFAIMNPEILEIPVAEALLSGVVVHAENEDGVHLEVMLYMAGGKRSIHVEVPANRPDLNCFRLSQELGVKVATILAEVSKATLSPMHVGPAGAKITSISPAASLLSSPSQPAKAPNKV